MATAFKGRREDQRLVTGAGRYTADWNLPGQLYAVFLRADRAHAIIRSIDKSAAERAPGVVAVLTARDVADAGFRTLPPSAHFPGRGGMKCLVPERPVLATDRVRYVGEEVAVVVAETREQAADATELIEIDYQDLAPVIGFDIALAAGATLLHETIPGNVCFDFEYGNEAKTAEVIDGAAHVVRLTLESPRVAPNTMETRGAVAAYDAATDRYEIYCGHQGGPAMRDALAVAASINRVAVLLDADNFEGVQLPELKAWFEQRGQLLIFRAYGNQKTFAGSVWQHALEVGLDLVTCDVRPQAADMAIAVDLGVLASARQYHELYVVSGDRALLIAAEHVASRFGERQHVYWGLPHPLMHHTVQCQIGTKHARKEELVGLLELLIFQGGGRVKSDALHRTLLDTVPWFHARIYGAETFIFFLSEHFVIERAGEGCYVSLPDGGRSVGVTAPLPPVAPGRVGNDRRRRRDHDRRE